MVSTKDKNSAREIWVDAHRVIRVCRWRIDLNIQKTRMVKRVREEGDAINGIAPILIAYLLAQSSQNLAQLQIRSLDVLQASGLLSRGRAPLQATVQIVAHPPKTPDRGVGSTLMKREGERTISVGMPFTASATSTRFRQGMETATRAEMNGVLLKSITCQKEFKMLICSIYLVLIQSLRSESSVTLVTSAEHWFTFMIE